MPSPSLLAMATRTAIRNAASITDFADIPYEQARPILKKIDNPRQLHEIEVNCPQIADADAELWRAFIARDIPGWQKKIMEPKNPRSWWKVYRKLINAERNEKQAQEEALRQQLQNAGSTRARNETQFVQAILPEPPTSAPFVDGMRNPRFAEPRSYARKVNMKNARNGKEVMTAIRRESAQAHKVKGLNRNFNRTRDHFLPHKPQITEAPQSMVEDRLKARGILPRVNPQLEAARTAWASWEGDKRSTGSKIFTPHPHSKSAQNEKRIDDAVRKGLAEREQKLRALTATGARPIVPIVAGRTQAATATRPQVPTSKLKSKITTSSQITAGSNAPLVEPTCVSSPPSSNVRSAATRSPAAVKAATQSSPPRLADMHHHKSTLAEVAGSSNSSASVIMKKRPAPTSVFMPGKKRKV